MGSVNVVAVDDTGVYGRFSYDEGANTTTLELCGNMLVECYTRVFKGRMLPDECILAAKYLLAECIGDMMPEKKINHRKYLLLGGA